MSFSYHIYPIEGDQAEVISLVEGENEVILRDKCRSNCEGDKFLIYAQNGFLTLNNKSFTHNSQIILKCMTHESSIETIRTVSIVKRGQLDICEAVSLKNEPLQSSDFPFDVNLPGITESSPSNSIEKLKIRWNDNGRARYTCMVSINLDDTGCKLLWCPYPCEKPDMQQMAQICMSRPVHETMRGWLKRPLPLRTACFEREYPFNGTLHQKEPNTPKSLQVLLTTVKQLFNCGNTCGPNMIFCAYYPTGTHKILRHSDSKELGELKHVFAFVDGSTREMSFYRRENSILKIEIPPGFYCMYGEKFQEIFEHEIKETHKKQFNKLLKQRAEDFEDIPKDRYKRARIPQAEYIAVHKEEIRKVLNDSEKVWFNEWVAPRISYTLRKFK